MLPQWVTCVYLFRRATLQEMCQWSRRLVARLHMELLLWLSLRYAWCLSICIRIHMQSHTELLLYVCRCGMYVVCLYAYTYVHTIAYGATVGMYFFPHICIRVYAQLHAVSMYVVFIYMLRCVHIITYVTITAAGMTVCMLCVYAFFVHHNYMRICCWGNRGCIHWRFQHNWGPGNSFQRFLVQAYYWKTVEKQETDPQLFWKRRYVQPFCICMYA